MSNCPRCAKPLEESQVDSVAVQFCRDCKGLLLAHTDLTAILEASWRAVPVEEAERQSLARPDKADADREVFCPFCQKRMDKYGYLGLAAVTIDRCDECTRVWLDSDELPRMVLALAKLNNRSEKQRRQEQREVSQDPLAVGAATGIRRVNDPADWFKEAAAYTLLRLVLRV